MRRCSLAPPVFPDFSEHKGELLLLQLTRDLSALLQAGGFVASWLLYHLSMSLPSFPPSSRGKPSRAAKSAAKKCQPYPTQTPNKPPYLVHDLPLPPQSAIRSKPRALLLGPSISHPGPLQGQPCSIVYQLLLFIPSLYQNPSMEGKAEQTGANMKLDATKHHRRQAVLQ